MVPICLVDRRVIIDASWFNARKDVDWRFPGLTLLGGPQELGVGGVSREPIWGN